MKRFSIDEPLYNELGGDVKMKCDFSLTKAIIKPPFPNRHFIMAITGPPGSGKTSILLKMLQKSKKKEDNVYFKVFSEIIWVCPQSSRNSIESGNPLADLKPEVIFDELDYSVQEMIEKNKKNYDEEGKCKSQLLIVDDCGSVLKDSIEMLNVLAMNHRHLNLSIIILTQYTVSLPKSIRAQIGFPILFKPSAQDYKTIHSEYLPELSNNEFNYLAKIVWKEKHDNLIINRSNNTYYKNLGKINMN